MGLRIIYKNGESKQCRLTEANELVATQGWSWTKESTTTLQAVKKAVSKPKKAKVKVETEVIDFGSIKEE
tara:strand:+ start:1586 stop:1795 length:210 start_codon:yes stop_codon:yes gene_type:complete